MRVGSPGCKPSFHIVGSKNFIWLEENEFFVHKCEEITLKKMEGHLKGTVKGSNQRSVKKYSEIDSDGIRDG